MHVHHARLVIFQTFLDRSEFFHDIGEGDECVTLGIESIKDHLDLNYAQQACFAHLPQFFCKSLLAHKALCHLDRVVFLLYLDDAAVETRFVSRCQVLRHVILVKCEKDDGTLWLLH